MPNEHSLTGFVHLAVRRHHMAQADGIPPGPAAGCGATQRPHARIFLRRVVKRVMHMLSSWRRSVAESNELRAMSDRELRDIGISRYDTVHRANQGFWRGPGERL